MNKYRIFETEEFSESLDRLTSRDVLFIRKKLDNYVYPQIRQMPVVGPHIKKLRGYMPPTWRYRIGNFRVFYMIEEDEKIVVMLTIDHRKNAYR